MQTNSALVSDAKEEEIGVTRTHQRSLGLWAVVLLVGCASIDRPTVTQLTSNPAVFTVAYPLAFTTSDGKDQIEVPRGFVTDLRDSARLPVLGAAVYKGRGRRRHVSRDERRWFV